MTSEIESDSKAVIVAIDAGHRIGFAMEELDAASTSGEITTEWAGGVAPASVEVAVRGAKAEVEACAAQHHASKPDEARVAREEGKGLGRGLKDILGLP